MKTIAHSEKQFAFIEYGRSKLGVSSKGTEGLLTAIGKYLC